MLRELISFMKSNKRLGLENFYNYFFLKRFIKKENFKKEKQKINIKKIIFFARDKKGVVRMRGHFLSDALNKKGFRSEVCIGKLPEELDDCAIIFIKYFPYKEVKKALNKNCLIIYDVVDDGRPFLLENEGKICDAIIFTNKVMQRDFKKKLSFNTRSIVSYHNAGPEFKGNKPQQKKFAIAYFGGGPEVNALYHQNIEGLKICETFKEQFNHRKDFNCFYSMRKKGSHNFLYKPSTKVATAASIGGNIITSKEPSAVELLGKDYPYLTDDDWPSVKKTIEYAKKTFGKKPWKDGLKKMAAIQKKTSPESVAKEYINLVRSFK